VIALLLALGSAWYPAAAAGPESPAREAPARPAPSPKRARVLVVQDSAAVHAFNPQPDRVRAMVGKGVRACTGKSTDLAAWRSLVSTQDTVGIKVYTSPGPMSGTRRAVVAAVIEGLLAAGLPPSHIIVWDKREVDLRLADYFQLADRYGVRVLASAESGWDEKVFYDTALIGNLVWGDLEFGRKGDGVGRKSHVSRLVTRDLTKIISIAPLLNHNDAGVTGHLYSLALGSVDNTIRFDSDRERLNVAVPELIALPALGDRVVLNIVDALICQYEGEQRSLLHYSATLNELRFSTDPVALDVLSILELDHQRQLAKVPYEPFKLDLYHNASLLEIGISDRARMTLETLH